MGGTLAGVRQMEDISLHILDVVENSIGAGASNVEILLVEDTGNDLLSIEIKDDGAGMDEETRKMVTDPFFTTKTVRRIGLGLPLLKQAAEECDGSFSVSSEKGKGTIVSARFRRSHIDRKPLGDIGATMTVLIAGNPDVDFVLHYVRDDYDYGLNTAEIRDELEGVPINSPEVLKVLRKDIDKGLRGREDRMEETYG
jgi:anti-sigma regulatory factor (Ser/Thr protein kinase)